MLRGVPTISQARVARMAVSAPVGSDLPRRQNLEAADRFPLGGWQRKDKERNTHSHGAQDEPDPPDLNHQRRDGQCDSENTDGHSLRSRRDSVTRPVVRDVASGNPVRQQPAIEPV